MGYRRKRDQERLRVAKRNSPRWKKMWVEKVLVRENRLGEEV